MITQLINKYKKLISSRYKNMLDVIPGKEVR